MRKRKSTKPEKKTAKTEPAKADMPSEGEGQGFDFGGLPPRDLKKNLGCG